MSSVRLLCALALWCVACEYPDEPCEGPNGPCTVIGPGVDDDARVQTALIEAEPGDVILLEAGTYRFTRDLSLTTDGVTVRGRGMDDTILSFAGQDAGAQGLLITGDDVAVEDLAVEDAAGDAVKFEGTDGVTVRRVRVEWTGGPSADNGAYGIYPVRCSRVLIENSVAIGASDAGIYVGQSERVVVRYNRAQFNVAGIEIENTTDADVFGNFANHNTGGILVFNLPRLPVPGGQRTRVFDNEVRDNNTANFAPAGAIVGKIPRGTGVALLAAREVEVFDNTIRDNDTVNLGILSYFSTELPLDDPAFDPYSHTIYVHDNRFVGGGTAPTDELGFIVVQGLSTVLDAPIVVPDIVIDGYQNPDLLVDGELPDDKKICLQNNGSADFADIDRPNDFADVSLDAEPHRCRHPPLPTIVLP